MKITTHIFCALALVFIGTPTWAQESTEIEVTGIQDVEGGPATMIFSSEESDGAGGITSSMRVMSADPGAMAFVGEGGDFMSFGGSGGDAFSMLSNRSVQKDLELVDDQMEQIREVQKDFSKRIRDAVGDLSKGGFDMTRVEDLKEAIADMQKQKKEEINKLLLPHQQSRLKQVALQMQMKNRGTAKAIAKIAEELGMTDEQVEKLQERSKELKKEIEEKTKELKANAKEELMGMLSSDQRKKLKEMIGDEYKPSTKDWQENMPAFLKKRLPKPSSKD